MPTTDDETTVLIVDGRESADRYADWLADAYEVRRARDGETALSAVDEDVDAVLLARTDRGGVGDDVLLELRERHDTPVAFVSDAAPDYDLVGLPVDEYLRTPADRADVYLLVDTLLARGALDEDARACMAARTRVELLAETESERSLASHGEFIDLLDAAGRPLPSTDEERSVAESSSD